MRSVSPTFIGCRLPLADARIVIYGIPFEGRVNLRKGADAGTLDVRLGSESIETYSPALARDLEDLAIADIGDCELPDGAPPREQLDAAREQIAAWWRPGLIPFMLGGDHTATVPVIEVLAPAFPDLRILHLDAHPDLREEFLGERYNYASAMARVVGRAPLRLREKSRIREYSAPRFYEIAFDLNRKGEVDFLVHCFRRFSRRPVRRVVDIACGTGPHLMRLADRGYKMSGLDLSPRNIQFLGERLAARGRQGELVIGDMTNF